MNKFHPIISLYLIKNLFKNILIFFAIFSFISIVLELFELIRKAQGKDIIFTKLLLISFFKVPFIIFELLPFIFLYSGIVTFSKLNNYNELVAIKYSGTSYTSLIGSVSFFVIIFGYLIMTFLQPVSAAMLDMNSILKNQYFGYKTNIVSLKSNGIWIIDKVNVNLNNSNDKIVFAKKVVSKGKSLSNVQIFIAGKENNYVESYFATSAEISNNKLLLNKAKKYIPGEKSTSFDQVILETSIKPSQLHESVKDPELISFWHLGKMIDQIRESGIDATKHELYYKNLFVLPFLYLSLVIYSFIFSLQIPRYAKQGLPYIKASILGLAIYFFNKISGVLSLTSVLLVEVSVIVPTLIYLSSALAYLLHCDEVS